MSASSPPPTGPGPVPGGVASDPDVGTTVGGKYKLLALVAKGGMGRIYQAEQLSLGRIVALKMLLVSRDQEEDPEFRQRFFNEAATLGRLKHPNTVTVFDYGHLDERDSFFMVMEYVEGRTLSQALREEGAMHPARALRIIYEVSRALTEAHALSIVHRDLKPANIMLVDGDEGEQVKVLDFGIAKVLSQTNTQITQTNAVIGSPKYMAPEQVKQDPIDGRADIYALGCVLYHLICGAPPFDSGTTVQLLMAHVGQAPKPLRVRRPEVPELVEQVVMRCLEKEPEDRYSDIDAFKVALRMALAVVDADGSHSFSGKAPSLAEIQALTGRAPIRLSEDHSVTTMVQASPLRTESSKLPYVAIGLLMFALVFAVALLISLALLGGLWSLSGDEGSSSANVTTEPVTPRVDVAPAVDDGPVNTASDPAPPPAQTLGTVSFTSTPPGATVVYNGEPLGVTPLTAPIAWPEGELGKFELRLDGFVPVQVVKPWSSSEVEVDVRLDAVTAAPRPVVRPSTPKPGPGLDINMER